MTGSFCAICQRETPQWLMHNEIRRKDGRTTRRRICDECWQLMPRHEKGHKNRIVPGMATVACSKCGERIQTGKHHSRYIRSEDGKLHQKLFCEDCWDGRSYRAHSRKGCSWCARCGAERLEREMHNVNRNGRRVRLCDACYRMDKETE